MWQILLQNWLRQQAQATIFEAAQQARGAASQPADDEPTEPPPPADVGFVFALPIESGGLVDLLDGALKIQAAPFTLRQGGFRGRSIVLIESGVGAAQAAAATERLILGHQPPWIISAGFSGALQPQLGLNDLVLVNQVCGLHGESLSIDVRISPAEVARIPGLHLGRVVTVDKIVGRRVEKQSLGETSGALAVDMETLAVAQVCQQHKVRFLAVRVISDTLEDELSDDIERLVRQRTFAGQLGAAATAIWKRPSNLKQMWNLKERAIVASDRLAKFLAGMIPQLVPTPAKLTPPNVEPGDSTPPAEA